VTSETAKCKECEKMDETHFESSVPKGPKIFPESCPILNSSLRLSLGYCRKDDFHHTQHSCRAGSAKG